MLVKNWLIVLLLIFTIKAYGQQKVIYLENEFIKAGFLPDVGGRMVFLAPVGEANFLLSDSTLWNESPTERIEPKASSPFKAYNGVVTWLGPQSDWWTRQDILPDKKARADLWPPDPFLIYSNFKVVKHTATLLEMQGPESPVSGVQLFKRFELVENTIKMEVVAENIRDEELAWDLWSNARFPATTIFRVPVGNENDVRIKALENDRTDTMRYQFRKGYFTFLTEYPSNSKQQRISKAFIYPAFGQILVINQMWNLTIQFDRVDKEKIHPEQALVEVYNCLSKDGRSDILELEHHSAYQVLQPGESMRLAEVWTIKKEPIRN